MIKMMEAPKGMQYWRQLPATEMPADDIDASFGFEIDSNAPEWAKDEFNDYKNSFLNDKITY